MHFLPILAISCVASGMRVHPYDNHGCVSFIDSIYGDLVNTPDSYEHKMLLLEKNQIGIQNHDNEDFDIGSMKVDEYLEIQADLKAYGENRFAEKSHEAYLKYQTKLNLPDDDDTSDIVGASSLFGGILTFGKFNHFNCFSKAPEDIKNPIDIAIVGAPFDTGVSYRPGARFGPEGIRLAARRLGGAAPVRTNGHKNSNLTHINPYDKRTHNLSIIDCGDVPLTPFDNRIALNQLYRGERAIHNHESGTELNHPKIITMGGDHTITLMALKSAYEKYGKLNVIHFDSHIDTWNPKILGGGITNYMKLNHGTFLHYASEQGYLNSTGCYHVGLRAPYINEPYDAQHDIDCGFKSITARDIDHMGINGIISTILDQIGTESPVYITVDIDVLDPAFAPATGTMEIGGWSSRELLSVLDGLEGINLVGADVVEVSPPFDTNSEITQLAATQVIDSFLGLMIVKEVIRN